MFKTLLFILVVYLLVRAISRLFLPSKKRKSGGAKFFYQVFNNMQKHQKQQQNRGSSPNNPGNSPGNHFEEIEEAEYEEITEDDANTS